MTRKRQFFRACFSVEKNVDYRVQLFIKNCFDPLVKVVRVLIDEASPYLSTVNQRNVLLLVCGVRRLRQALEISAFHNSL
jgi:hypothetical protein